MIILAHFIYLLFFFLVFSFFLFVHLDITIINFIVNILNNK